MQDYRRPSAAGSRPPSTERHRQSPARQNDAPSAIMTSESLHKIQTLEDYSRSMHRHTQGQIERLPSVAGQDSNDRNGDPRRSPRGVTIYMEVLAIWKLLLHTGKGTLMKFIMAELASTTIEFTLGNLDNNVS
ncbi:hypothetical protein GX51_03612 [Blastomyces parvus]|uniref:Uncharacterized protein n=1 Tax=Blastomyces parvus TaxID=2060905 RepID=A0A2B7X6A3_9EURO|nr:hypothetical protein GX51_03612 [Blastomyces parvus]